MRRARNRASRREWRKSMSEARMEATIEPDGVVRTPAFALKLAPGWVVGEPPDPSSLLLRSGEMPDEELVVHVLPKLAGFLELLCVEQVRESWSKGGGLPPLAQEEKVGTHDGFSCTFDQGRYRVTSVAFPLGSRTVTAVCSARLERFPAVWPAAHRMLSSIVAPDRQPGLATGRLRAGLGGLTSSWLDKMMELVKSELRQRSLEGEFDDDRVRVGEASLSLEGLAKQCRDAHGYEYAGLVRRCIEANEAALRGGAGDAASFEAMRERLLFQLYRPGLERTRNAIWRSDLEGTVSLLTLDEAFDYAPVTEAQAASWGRDVDALFTLARENLSRRRVETRRQAVGDGEMLVLGQPVIGASYALVLDAYPSALGRRGAFVGVPVRDVTMVLPFADDGSLSVLLGGFVQGVRDTHDRDAYGIAPTVYYFDRLAFEPLSWSEADGIVRLTAGPRLAEALRKGKKPTLVEVDARDTEGRPIWGGVEEAVSGEVGGGAAAFLREAEGALTDRPEGNAEVMRALVKRCFGTELEWSVKGLEALDRVLEREFPGDARKSMPSPALNLIACYFGQVMRLTQGGEWTRQSRSALGWGLAFGPPKLGLVRKPDGPVVDIRLRTRQCLGDGKKLSSAYWSLQYDIAQMRRD
jgi:hypothetical protein